ncbi:hypothetical protein KAR91_53475 [Candidatus Pacearchaeota archaeon]|nr:hypothetical protein [Candidatus Pacearchaeota archaeon]
MNHLIMYTSTNRKGQSDSSGAFEPEAHKLHGSLFARTEGIVDICGVRTVNYSLANRRKQVDDTASMAGAMEVEAVWLLCHGQRIDIQWGYRWKWGAKKLVSDIVKTNPNVSMINFYCCSVANSNSNFCKWVFDELQKQSNAKDVSVFGHYSAGHTTMNPNIKIYTTGYKPFMWSSKNYADYNQLVATGKVEAKRRMRDLDDDLRFSIPFYVQEMKRLGYTWGWK